MNGKNEKAPIHFSNDREITKPNIIRPPHIFKGLSDQAAAPPPTPAPRADARPLPQEAPTNELIVEEDFFLDEADVEPVTSSPQGQAMNDAYARIVKAIKAIPDISAALICAKDGQVVAFQGNADAELLSSIAAMACPHLDDAFASLALGDVTAWSLINGQTVHCVTLSHVLVIAVCASKRNPDKTRLAIQAAINHH